MSSSGSTRPNWKRFPSSKANDGTKLSGTFPTQVCAVRVLDFNSEEDNVSMHVVGKGIADQDRNILSNQLLILGFLRSVSGFLVRGPPPALERLKKKGKAREEEDGTDVDSDQEVELSGQTGPSRGAVIITLRNVLPYTDCNDFFWCWRASLIS